MFILIRIFGMLILLSQCNSKPKKAIENPIAQKEVVISNENNLMAQDQLLSVTYEAASRGAFYQVIIDKNTVKKSKDRSLNNKKEKFCSKNEWSLILSEIENIELENIENLEASSNNRTMDRSLHAKLIITFPSQVYTSVSFDHGNPPEQIVPLVNTILSLAESVE